VVLIRLNNPEPCLGSSQAGACELHGALGAVQHNVTKESKAVLHYDVGKRGIP